MHERNKDRSLPYPDNIIKELGSEGLTSAKFISVLSSGFLKAKEKDVLERYYKDNERYEDIGRTYGVSKEYIRQITEKGLDKIRKHIRMEGIAARLTGKAV